MKSLFSYLALIIFGFLSVFTYRYFSLRLHPSTFKPESALLAPNPPSSALSGQIVSTLGIVTHQTRQSSNLPAAINDAFLQGEGLQTSNFSTVEVVFSDFVDFQLSPVSDITLINTNPQNFLVNQSGGVVDYQLLSADKPVSVRILHLLIQLNSGQSQITIDSQKIKIHLISGSLSLAYNDKTNTTNIHNFTGPKTITFDDTLRTYRLQK